MWIKARTLDKRSDEPSEVRKTELNNIQATYLSG